MLPPETTVISWAQLLLRSMFGFTAQLQVMSQVTTKTYVCMCSLGCLQRSCEYLKAVPSWLSWMTCRAEWLVLPLEGVVISRPMLLLGAMSGPVHQLQPESLLMSEAHVTTEVYAHVHGLDSHWKSR